MIQNIKWQDRLLLILHHGAREAQKEMLRRRRKINRKKDHATTLVLQILKEKEVAPALEIVIVTEGKSEPVVESAIVTKAESFAVFFDEVNFLDISVKCTQIEFFETLQNWRMKPLKQSQFGFYLQFLVQQSGILNVYKNQKRH